jgi:hypothetical protein
MRPDYCPIGGEPCQSMCAEPCSTKEVNRLRRIEKAARNLVAQKGRHNTETAYHRLEEALMTKAEGK